MPEHHGHLALGEVLHLVGTVLLGAAATMAVCALAGAALGDGSSAPLALSAVISAAAGGGVRLATRKPSNVNFREAFVTVTFAWAAVALAGALPYLLSGAIPAPAAALFESMSGFTTTGSSVLADIEAVQPGILLWRSVTQWLGGMGFIVLGVAVLPYLGVGGMQLFRLEAPGPTADRLQPRIQQTAKLLWVVYGALTVLAAGAYGIGGMGFLDAVNHALTTLPTGGFSTRNASMAAFGPFIQWSCIVFMFLAGTSFTLHYRTLQRGPRAYLRDTEWRLYAGIVAAGTLAVLALNGAGGSAEAQVRDAAFQVVSIVTTTGYGSADYVLWAPAAQLVLFLLFFLGGMAGSTAGGMKMVRVLLVLKHAWMEIRKQLHPRAVFVPKVGGRPVREHVMLNVLGFILIYMMLFGVGSLAMAMLGLSLPAAAGAAATAISNVGPGLAELGPVANFGELPPVGHLVLTFLMLVGRLEIYTVLLLFHPGLWRR